jgi:hypothetical protein
MPTMPAPVLPVNMSSATLNKYRDSIIIKLRVPMVSLLLATSTIITINVASSDIPSIVWPSLKNKSEPYIKSGPQTIIAKTDNPKNSVCLSDSETESVLLLYSLPISCLFILVNIFVSDSFIYPTLPLSEANSIYLRHSLSFLLYLILY